MAFERLVVINDFSRQSGGATSLALLCAKLMREVGVHVTYITGDEGNDAVFAAADIEHVALGCSPFARRTIVAAAVQGLWNDTARRRISEWIARNDDPRTVYHLHGWHAILSPSIFAALMPVAGRLLVHAHDFFLVCPNGGFMNFPSGHVCGLRPLSGPCLLSNCDRRRYSHKMFRVVRHMLQNRIAESEARSFDVILIHARMASFFQRSGWTSPHLFPLPNPCVPFSPAPVKAWDNACFFYVGRLNEEKGAYDFAAAAHEAGVPAVIIGDGPDRSLIARDFKHVELPGWCSMAEISELIQRARCVVMPSRYPEPFGLVAVEALGSGIPVIASHHAFIAGDIQSLGMGLSVDTRDRAAFAAALALIARDDRLVNGMSMRALHESAKLCSTLPEWRDALLAHYRRVIDRASSAPVSIGSAQRFA
jgi:glycosyltransferase involved in cell wall biosynthesis